MSPYPIPPNRAQPVQQRVRKDRFILESQLPVPFPNSTIGVNGVFSFFLLFLFFYISTFFFFFFSKIHFSLAFYFYFLFIFFPPPLWRWVLHSCFSIDWSRAQVLYFLHIHPEHTYIWNILSACEGKVSLLKMGPKRTQVPVSQILNSSLYDDQITIG